MRNRIISLLLLVTVILSSSLLFSCGMQDILQDPAPKTTKADDVSPVTDQLQDDSDDVSVSSVPEYSGSPYVEINGGEPQFTEKEITTYSFESYSELDSLGRCGEAYACLGRDLMPTGERESIYSVKPTGWHSAIYDIVDQGSLYNRSHLIAFSLAGENANERNLITGTRYMNYDGMRPFEEMTCDYIKETGNHVMYRVTPMFTGNNLIADGVHMEAYSVEDKGEGISFNIYCYNVQPGITIDYATGESHLSEYDNTENDYVLNTYRMKFHLPSCQSVSEMNENNKEYFHGTREELIEKGYEPCNSCRP